jgi:hypothetical protein
MLSPKATKRLTLNFGGTVTVTAKVQTSARALESVTVHATVVVPTPKFDPVAGVQVGPTSGASPPVTVGSEYTTETGPPSGDVVETGLGQVSFGATGSGVGVTGVLSPHACRKNVLSSVKRSAMGGRDVRGKAQLTH